MHCEILDYARKQLSNPSLECREECRSGGQCLFLGRDLIDGVFPKEKFPEIEPEDLIIGAQKEILKFVKIPEDEL